MPTSPPENKPWVLEKIVQVNPTTILDIGPGEGTFADLLKNVLPNAVIDGVEIWEPYITKYNLVNKYNNIIVRDVREHDDFNYDLVIFGDVLEHMSEEDAIKVWEKASKQAKYAIISLPIIHYPQGEYGGNPYEVHVEEDWNEDRVLKTFSHIVEYKSYRVAGGFLAKFGEN